MRGLGNSFGGYSSKCPFSLPLFLLGLFSRTELQVIGSIGISELFCFVAGPFFLMMDWQVLRRYRCTKFIILTILMLIGGWISNEYNHVGFGAAIRGLATPYSFIASIPVFHHFLRKDIRQSRWYFWGFFLSSIICVFVFQRASGDMTREEAMESAMGYSLFWLSQFINLVRLPMNAYFLETPHMISLVLALFLAFFSFAQSNNRSGLLIWGGSFLLVFLFKKRVKAMTFLKRHFWILIAGAAIVSPLVNFAYKTLAVQGYLGENAQTKYEQQVLKRSKKSGVLDTLKAARGDFFIGLEAAIEQPILGYGSWAIDKKNKVLDYYHKNDVDLDSLKMLLENLAQGKAITLPCHSWVIQGWLWWGIFGFAWMIALGLLMYRTLRYNMTVYPHLYGYFAFALPSYFWAWLFSPFGQRTQVAVFITLALLADWQRRENKRLGYA